LSHIIIKIKTAEATEIELTKTADEYKMAVKLSGWK
jgi:hypothetical protein